MSFPLHAGRRPLAGLVVCLAAAAAPASSASAEGLAPWWGLTSGARPTQLSAGPCGAAGQPACGEIFVSAENLGDAATSGVVTIADQLPPGVTVVGIKALAGGPASSQAEAAAPAHGTVRCSTKTLTCTFEQVVKEKEVVPPTLPPFEQIEMRISVRVEQGAAEAAAGGVLENTATVSGGGAASARTVGVPLHVGGPERFGIEGFTLIPEEEGGAPDTQAGSHPFQVTSVITLDSQTPDYEGRPRSAALPRDIVAELPPGFIGNPTPFQRCTDAQFAQKIELEGQQINACPPASAIGAVALTITEPTTVGFGTIVAPIFNMVPRPGEPARFGFKAAGVVSVFLDTSLRSGGDYGVNVGSLDISQAQWLLSAKLTFWGVPGAPQHDHQRGWDCLEQIGGAGACSASSESAPPPFLVMPTSCEAPFEGRVHADTWTASGKPPEAAKLSYTLPEAIDGCNGLPFAPSIRVTPDGGAASTPTGLNVDVHVPQNLVLDAETRAESAVKGITVALPQGVAVDPSGADGLEACSEGLAGFTGIAGLRPDGPPVPTFTSTLPAPLEQGVNFCPDASKIGTVRIATPLLPKGQDVTGSVYLASQNANPFGSLIALYLLAEDPVSGAIVKLVGETHVTETGQLVSTFGNNPQLAFEDAELHFFGGERAPLATPARCGAYTTDASFAPWSGNPPVASHSTFQITTGPNGGPCPGASLPFHPSLTGGTVNVNAGAFSQLRTTIGRQDGQQNMASVRLRFPPGASGMLSGVKLCGEAQANEGTCGPESLIGETTVSAGVGSDPVSVKGGRVYITGPYHGAPFGLSIVNPVKAGPFDLEHDTANPSQNPACDCIVVRARIEVDPHTAALTVTTNSESEGFAIPHMIDGVPVQIKAVNVSIDRERFTFNPTSCDPMKITGEIKSDEGAGSPVEVPFQVANCGNLAFEPKFAVSTSGKTSKAGGASLSVKLTYPNVPQGTDANIKQVKVELPTALPSRLTTLQKACTAAQFDANPAGCPAASIIGHAKAITPLIPVPLEGPAYFVSNGGEAFPNLIVVLQGYGVTVDLVGDTFISKTGITSSTFKTVPDAPVGSFELTLPQGPYSALAANGNLCALTKTVTIAKKVKVKRHGHTKTVTRKVKAKRPASLTMPTEFVAQNGATLHTSTPIGVTGCPKAKKGGAKAKKASVKRGGKSGKR